jgi:hypothetical protein
LVGWGLRLVGLEMGCACDVGRREPRTEDVMS